MTSKCWHTETHRVMNISSDAFKPVCLRTAVYHDHLLQAGENILSTLSSMFFLICNKWEHDIHKKS